MWLSMKAQAGAPRLRSVFKCTRGRLKGMLDRAGSGRVSSCAKESQSLSHARVRFGVDHARPATLFTPARRRFRVPREAAEFAQPPMSNPNTDVCEAARRG